MRRKGFCEFCGAGPQCAVCGRGCPSRIDWPLVAAYAVVGMVAFGGTLAALWFVEG
jgi:hypothetical protein